MRIGFGFDSHRFGVDRPLRLADVLGIPVGAVSVKGKTNEGMDALGRGEGLAVHVAALLNGS